MAQKKKSLVYKPTKRQAEAYKKLAKKADARIRAIESWGEQEYYSIAATGHTFAYRRTLERIEQKYGWTRVPNKKNTYVLRFGSKVPQTRGELKEKMAMMESFLKMKTATKKGITEMYEKRAATMNKKYGTDLSWKDWAQLFASGIMEENDFGSDTFSKTIATLRNNSKDVKQKLDDLKQKHMRGKITDDDYAKAVNEAKNELYADIKPRVIINKVKKMVNDDSIPWNELLNGAV